MNHVKFTITDFVVPDADIKPKVIVTNKVTYGLVKLRFLGILEDFLSEEL